MKTDVGCILLEENETIRLSWHILMEEYVFVFSHPEFGLMGDGQEITIDLDTRTFQMEFLYIRYRSIVFKLLQKFKKP